jgi:hypothetical protein
MRLPGIILLPLKKISALVLIEGARLNLQHPLAPKVCNGHLVHPLIPLLEPKNVADMATGTGFVPIFPFLNPHLQVKCRKQLRRDTLAGFGFKSFFTPS